MSDPKIEGLGVSLSELSESQKLIYEKIQFVNKRVFEQRRLVAVLQRARNSYFQELKREVLASKAGLNLDL